MSPQMPRGAIPPRRSDLAAAEPYRPDGAPEIFVPSGAFPTPAHDLAAARPFKAAGVAPATFLAWAADIASWRDDAAPASLWAEEAFAKVCAMPHVALPTEAVLEAARACGASNFAAFMQTHGFKMDGTAYRSGPYYSVDWSDIATLKAAIAEATPVKIGVATANLASGPHGRVTLGVSGWATYDLPTTEPQDHCASLCGYGPLAALIGLFRQHGIDVEAPEGMPSDLCFAMSIWGSIGILDHQSLMNITGEAWVRRPTTIVRPYDV